MRKAYIFHGTGGHDKENWFPRLKTELENLGIETTVPSFGKEMPNIQSWAHTFENYRNNIDEDSILIGHSLGGSFLLKILETIQTKVHLVVTVGSPIGVKPIKFYDNDSKFLNGFSFDWEKITKKYNHSVVFHSDNDPYVSLGNGEQLAKKLGTKLKFIPQAGHFNEASGYTTFPQLLQEIQRYL